MSEIKLFNTKSQIMAYWNEIADEWEKKIGDKGDPFRQYMLTPLIFDLLSACKGKTCLDVGCGNGYLIPMLIKKGFKTYGLDISTKQLQYAKKRAKENCLYNEDIETIKVNRLQRFNIIIANMVLDGIENINFALQNCYSLLAKRGSLIFTIPHPCFYYQSKGITSYLKERHSKVTMVNVTRGVLFFHRPVAFYLNALIENGFIIKKILEPPTPSGLKSYLKQTGRSKVPCFFIGVLASKEN
jgi:2-polyprenyl-3-methyl-5-hydroxy-6-metoxy-1,4-benzoquinol methylase